MYLKPECLLRIDNNVRETAVKVTNAQMNDNAWAQASLPVRHGGLGLRSVGSLALPCYISSLAKAQPLVKQILK